MFRKLIESEARAPRRPGWIFTSAGAHAMLIGLATALTLASGYLYFRDYFGSLGGRGA